MIGGNDHPFVAQLSLRRTPDAELVNGADDFEPGHVGPDEECRHAVHGFSMPVEERLRESRDHASAVAVADPDLPAVESLVRAILRQHRGRLDVLRVRSNLGLGQRISGEKITARQRREIALLLLIVAMEDDRLGPKSPVDADENSERSGDRRKGLKYAGGGG